MAEQSRPPAELWLERFDRCGDRVALRHRGTRWTHGELAAHVRGESRRLLDAGVGPGAVVAVLAGNHPVGFALRWAVGAVGATLVLLPDGLSADLAAGLLDTCGAGLVTAGPDHAATAAAIARARPGTAVLTCGDAVLDPAGAPPVTAPPETALLRLTGGSTGVPRAIPRRSRPPGPPVEDDPPVQLLCTPAAHLAGTLAESVLARGGTVVLHDGFDAGEVWSALARERVTMLWLQPRLLHELLDDPASATSEVADLTALLLGSAPSSPHRLAEALERFGPVVAEGYGTLEATQISWLSADEVRDPALRATVGRVVPGVEVRILDEAGRECPHGEVGGIHVRSAAVMSGYLDDPAATARVLHDGWFDTGDLGALDDRGYLTLVGRSSEVILGRHDRIHPAQHEQLLATHPDVSAAAVVPVTDADGVENAVAAVVARPGHTPDPASIRAWVAEERGAAQALDDVRVVDELPVTASAKIDRPAVALRVGQLLAGEVASSTAADQENPAPTPRSR